MRKENLFFLSFLATIVITRLSVFFIPNVDIYLGDWIVHHFWFGVILISFIFVIPKEHKTIRSILFGIGAGFILDQLVFMILGAGGDKEYWALPSSMSITIFTILIFFTREKLISRVC